MKKNKSRTFSMSDKVYEKFIEYCEINHLNRSAVVTNLIEQFMKDKNVNQTHKLSN